MPQRHDQGWKKRQPREQAEPPPDPEHLARELVAQGIASRTILSYSPYMKDR